MPDGSLTVQPDLSILVDKRPGEAPSALNEALAAFAEPVRATETQSTYRLTSASIWKARRHGLSLAEILQTLETHSDSEIPANVRTDIERWSQQIDRLTLESRQGQLLLRSHNPLAITAVMRHRTLGDFVKSQIDATTLELRPEAYPDMMQTFDACLYPVLDRVQESWHTAAAPPKPPKRRSRALERMAAARAQARRSQTSSRSTAASHTRVGPAELVDVLRTRNTRQCQATTRAGRQCKNRVQPPSVFCRVHADQTADQASRDDFNHDANTAGRTLDLMLRAGLITMAQLAIVRVAILVGVGLCTWLLYALLMWVGTSWLHLPLASWYMVGIAFLLTCWLLGRVLAGAPLLTSLTVLGITLISLLADFFNKDGLILNICFFLIPLVLPAVILYRYALSLWWGWLLFPLGFVLGKLFYRLLEESS